MSETDNTGGATPSEATRESLWQRLRSRFGRNRDVGLRESLEGAIESHEAQNPGATVGEEAKSMMLNIIEFSGLRVDDVMVPRVDIVAVDETDSMQDLLATFIDANHSRMPVYRETLDGITGMIHVKDFLRWMAARGTRKRRTTKSERPEKIDKSQPPGLSIAATALATSVKQAGLNREVLFVPPSMPATDLLVGDRIVVTLRVATTRPGNFVAIDDPLPAILEAVNPQFRTQQGAVDTQEFWNADYREVRADRVLYFCDHLPPGAFTFNYLARVRSAGTVTAPATKVEEMYRPERFGLSDTLKMTSRPAK